MSAYTTADSLKATLTMQGTQYADYDIDPCIEACSDALNSICNRKFDLDTATATTRYYRPASSTVIVVDDLIEIVSLTSDQDSDGDFEQEHVLDRDFFLWPYNALQEGRPYTQIHLNEYRVTTGFPWWSPRGVAVEAKFGWPELPSFLEPCTKLLATKLMKRMREAPFGIVTVGIDVGSAMRIAKTDPEIMFQIENYIRERAI